MAGWLPIQEFWQKSTKAFCEIQLGLCSLQERSLCICFICKLCVIIYSIGTIPCFWTKGKFSFLSCRGTLTGCSTSSNARPHLLLCPEHLGSAHCRLSAPQLQPSARPRAADRCPRPPARWASVWDSPALGSWSHSGPKSFAWLTSSLSAVPTWPVTSVLLRATGWGAGQAEHSNLAQNGPCVLQSCQPPPLRPSCRGPWPGNTTWSHPALLLKVLWLPSLRWAQGLSCELR